MSRPVRLRRVHSLEVDSAGRFLLPAGGPVSLLSWKKVKGTATCFPVVLSFRRVFGFMSLKLGVVLNGVVKTSDIKVLLFLLIIEKKVKEVSKINLRVVALLSAYQ